jgi:hypothetical protein
MAVLDPRITFNGLRQAYADDPEMTKDLVNSKRNFRNHFLATYAHALPAVTQPGASSSRPSHLNRLFARFASSTVSSTPSGPEAELDRLFQLQAESFDACPDPVEWWRTHRAQFPLLSRFARDILSIPGKLCSAYSFETITNKYTGSAVSVERVFSGGRDTVALRRASLSAETIRELMLVKHQLRREREHRCTPAMQFTGLGCL